MWISFLYHGTQARRRIFQSAGTVTKNEMKGQNYDLPSALGRRATGQVVGDSGQRTVEAEAQHWISDAEEIAAVAGPDVGQIADQAVGQIAVAAGQ
jgi:hypothetical protein